MTSSQPQLRRQAIRRRPWHAIPTWLARGLQGLMLRRQQAQRNRPGVKVLSALGDHPASPERLMNLIRRFIIVACVTSLSACAVMTAPRSGFLSRYTDLTPSSDGSSASIRSDMTVDPMRVAVGDIEWRAAGDDLSEEERRALLSHLRDELVARVRELPAAPDGRPIVLRAAITRVETVSPSLNAVSALLFVVPLDRGGAAVDVEALDQATGKQVAALTLGHFAPLSELKSRFSKLAPAQLALRKAANEFGALLRPASTSANAGGG